MLNKEQTKIINFTKEKYGTMSHTWLMRKFKMNHDSAMKMWEYYQQKEKAKNSKVEFNVEAG